MEFYGTAINSDVYKARRLRDTMNSLHSRAKTRLRISNANQKDHAIYFRPGTSAICGEPCAFTLKYVLWPAEQKALKTQWNIYARVTEEDKSKSFF